MTTGVLERPKVEPETAQAPARELMYVSPARDARQREMNLAFVMAQELAHCCSGYRADFLTGHPGAARGWWPR